jgi:hypothetical protein
MRISVKAKSTGNEDPFLEKLTNSLMVAFVIAALVKVYYFMHSLYYPIIEKATEEL